MTSQDFTEWAAAKGIALRVIERGQIPTGTPTSNALTGPKDVMPMQLRENLGIRLTLKVSSEATPKIALDRPGAELVMGRGHLAAKLIGEQGLVFAQAPF